MARRLLLALLVAVWSVSLAAAGPAPRTIRVSMTSFKFEPNIIRLVAGERVVLELVNEDPQRPHNLASELFNQVELTVRGSSARAPPRTDAGSCSWTRASGRRWSSPYPG
jgi:hypothetical protein